MSERPSVALVTAPPTTFPERAAPQPPTKAELLARLNELAALIEALDA